MMEFKLTREVRLKREGSWNLIFLFPLLDGLFRAVVGPDFKALCLFLTILTEISEQASSQRSVVKCALKRGNTWRELKVLNVLAFDNRSERV